MAKTRLLRCSFCNKDQSRIGKLISSPATLRRRSYICDECVEVCSSIIVDAPATRAALHALQRKPAHPETKPRNAVRIFYSYSHKDETLRNRLEEHLSSLKWAGHIASWHDRKIEAGDDWDRTIDTKLKDADITLLLISASFLASNYCYGREATYALERHRKRECRVIPVILKPVDWHHTPLADLQALPRDGKPITNWQNRDQAFVNVVQGIRTVIQEMRTHRG